MLCNTTLLQVLSVSAERQLVSDDSSCDVGDGPDTITASDLLPLHSWFVQGHELHRRLSAEMVLG